MVRASKTKQISFVTPDEIGILAKVSGGIAGAKININALSACSMQDKGYFMIVTDNNIKAKRALTKAGFEVTEEDVILVEMPNRVGEMQKVAAKIAAAGVNISYAYATVGSGRSTFCIFKTNNDKKAIRAIEQVRAR